MIVFRQVVFVPLLPAGLIQQRRHIPINQVQQSQHFYPDFKLSHMDLHLETSLESH
jgi:hypothetical protein